MRPTSTTHAATVAALLLGAGFVFFAASQSLQAQTSNCTPLTLPCPTVGATVSITIGGAGGGGGGGGGPREQTLGDVRLMGWGYPGGIVTLLVDGGVAASFVVGSDGRFDRTLPNIPAGIHAFSARGLDPVGRTSPTISVSVSVTGGITTTIAGLVLPPTISAAAYVRQGSPATISGYSFPGAKVFVFILGSSVPVGQVTAGSDGRWSYVAPTSTLRPGVYQMRARALGSAGEQSEFSQVVSLLVVFEGVPLPPVPPQPGEPPLEPPLPLGSCARGDLSGDGVVNLTDFSILIYWWGSQDACADQNDDSLVNLVDLSILLYWWRE